MNIDLDKTLGFEAGTRAGVEALLKTAERTPPAGLAEQIAHDLTFLTNQAVNTLLANPGKPAATLPLAQLVGYMGELARLTGRLAQGGPVIEGESAADQAATTAKTPPAGSAARQVSNGIRTTTPTA